VWAKLFYDAGDKIGREFRVNEENMTGYATQAGFTNIYHKKFKLPHGPWPKDKKLKDMGMFVGLYMDISLDGFAIYPIGQILGWTFEEVQILVAKMRSSIKNQRNMTNSDMCVPLGSEIGAGILTRDRHMIYGQKPENPVASTPVPAQASTTPAATAPATAAPATTASATKAPVAESSSAVAAPAEASTSAEGTPAET